MKRILAATVLSLVMATAAAQKGQKLRAEVGKPLQAAEKALQAKNYGEAMTQIDAAAKVSNLTPYESYVIARMKGSAALGKKDYKTALAAYEASIASGQLPEADKLPTLQGLVQIAYSAKDYPKTVDAIAKYRAAGGTDPQIAEILPQALYLQQKYPEAARELAAQIIAAEKAGRTPSENQLQLLASCALKQNDMTAYVASLERMVQYHPKPSYWTDLILRTAGKPGFADRLTLDVYRLRIATGTLERPGDYAEAVQLALQAGYPGEARTYLEEGFAKNLLGQGQDAERHTRLKALVDKTLAEDQKTLAEGEAAARKLATGDALISTGLNYVGYGQSAKGLPLIEEGIRKGGLKRPEDAKLHLGYAYLKAGQTDKAVASLKTAAGTEGAKELARLWIAFSKKATLTAQTPVAGGS